MTPPPVSAAPVKPGRGFSALLPFLLYVRRHRIRATAALAALAVSASATLYVPLALRQMIDRGFSNDNGVAVNAAFLAIAGAVAIIALAAGARFYLVTTLGERLAADLRVDTFARVVALDAGFFDHARSGELLSRLTADTTQIKATLSTSASIALRNLVVFVGSLAMMFVADPRLSLVVLLVTPPVVAPLIFSLSAVRRRARAAQDALAEAGALAVEHLGAIRTVQACCAEDQSRRRIGAALYRARDAARSTIGAQSLVSGLSIFLALGSVVAVFRLGAGDIAAGRMSLGALSQFVLFAVLGATSLAQMAETWGEIAAAAGAADRIADLLSAAPHVVAPANPAVLARPVRGEIRFEDVHFAYPAAAGAPAIRGMTLHIAPGERVAIVGPSGAGKTTIMQLLLRFYDPDAGRILIDGVDIATLAPLELRAQFALVAQDPVIFSGAVADNVSYGKPGASAAEIKSAARRAAADGFIRELPAGYGAEVGERGALLSGGQKQRLALARALIRNAPVLLLDEATSALDSESEALTQAALCDEARGRTSLVIAHRLGTIRNADRIIVIDQGRVVEEGTHASLVALDGLYARLARRQLETIAGASSV